MILCAVSLTAASCPKTWSELTQKPADRPEEISGSTAAFSSPPRKIADPDFGFSLTVPSDWELTKRDQNPVLFVRPQGAGPYGPMANVVIENLSQRMAPYDYLKANILTMQISLPGLEIKNGGVEINAGVSMAWIQYTYPRGEILVEALSYCQTKEYRAYVVTGLAPAKEFKKHESAFRVIGQSLRVK